MQVKSGSSSAATTAPQARRDLAAAAPAGRLAAVAGPLPPGMAPDMAPLFRGPGSEPDEPPSRAVKRKASFEHPEAAARATSHRAAPALPPASAPAPTESTIDRGPSPAPSDLPLPSFLATSSPSRSSPPPTDPQAAEEGQAGTAAMRRSARAQSKALNSSYMSIDGGPTLALPPAGVGETGPGSSQLTATTTSGATSALPSSRAATSGPASPAHALGRKDKSQKPPFSYAALIGQAVNSKPNKRISLNDIYTYIISHYTYYKKEDAGWQNSIRHNLSLNECFVKSPRTLQDQPGKGSLWCIVDGCEEQFANGGFVKRMNNKKPKPATKKAVKADGEASEAETSASAGTSKSKESAPAPSATPKAPAKRARKAAARKPPKSPSASERDVQLAHEQGEDSPAAQLEPLDASPPPARSVRRSRRHSKPTLAALEPEGPVDPEDEEPAEDADDTWELEDDTLEAPPSGLDGSRYPNSLTQQSQHLGLTSPRRAYVASPRSLHRRGPSFPDMAAELLLSPAADSAAGRFSALTSAASIVGSPSTHYSPFLPPLHLKAPGSSSLLQSPERGNGNIFVSTSPYLGATPGLLKSHIMQSPVSSMRSAFEDHGDDPGSADRLGFDSKGRPRAESSPAAPAVNGNTAQRSHTRHTSADEAHSPPAYVASPTRATRNGAGQMATSQALQFLQADAPAKGLNIGGLHGPFGG